MKTLRLPARISEGKLILSAPKFAAGRIAEQKDCYCVVIITEESKRSSRQNRYLHGILIPEFRRAMFQAGYDKVLDDEIAKLVMKSMFLKEYVVNPHTAEAQEFIRDTSDLTKGEMSLLYDRVIEFAWEKLNYRIPYPNQVLELDFKNE